MNVYCGIDWAEGHHDIALVDAEGRLLASRRIGDDLAGLNRLCTILAEHGHPDQKPVPIAIETPRGLFVSSLRDRGFPVYAINPLSAARYRDRHSVSRKKSDAQDAAVLANILRTDSHAHRRMAEDSELVRAISVLARAQQDAVWKRQNLSNEIRSFLREYYPASLIAFPKGKLLQSAEASRILRAAPTPARALCLGIPRITQLLRNAGRTRYLEREATRLHRILHSNALQMPEAVEQAYGVQLIAMFSEMDAAREAVDDLTQKTEELFLTHADAAIITSMPGLANTTGARILAEMGDDPDRFSSASSLKAYAGAAPVTRASGKSHAVTARRVKNNRLAAAGYVWAFSALTASSGARAHYDRRKSKATLIQPHNATCSTGFWAVCTTACRTASPIRNQQHSARLPRPHLDFLAPSDVFLVAP